MLENVMHSIGGTEMFGVISICIFFACFTGMVVWAGRLKKPYLHSMQDLPLDGARAQIAPGSGAEKPIDLQ
jgi:hypothetical protein